jgi:hypothetical protein
MRAVRWRRNLLQQCLCPSAEGIAKSVMPKNAFAKSANDTRLCAKSWRKARVGKTWKICAAPAPHSPSVSTLARGTDRKGAWGRQAARTADAQNCRRGNPRFGFAPYGKRAALSTVRAALAAPRLRACYGSPMVWAIPRLRVLHSGPHVPAAACPRMRSAAVHAVYMGTLMSKYAWGYSAPPCRSPLRPLRGGGARARGRQLHDALGPLSGVTTTSRALGGPGRYLTTRPNGINTNRKSRLG